MSRSRCGNLSNQDQNDGLVNFKRSNISIQYLLPPQYVSLYLPCPVHCMSHSNAGIILNLSSEGALFEHIHSSPSIVRCIRTIFSPMIIRGLTLDTRILQG